MFSERYQHGVGMDRDVEVFDGLPKRTTTELVIILEVSTSCNLFELLQKELSLAIAMIMGASDITMLGSILHDRCLFWLAFSGLLARGVEGSSGLEFRVTDDLTLFDAVQSTSMNTGLTSHKKYVGGIVVYQQKPLTCRDGWVCLGYVELVSCHEVRNSGYKTEVMRQCRPLDFKKFELFYDYERRVDGLVAQLSHRIITVVNHEMLSSEKSSIEFGAVRSHHLLRSYQVVNGEGLREGYCAVYFGELCYSKEYDEHSLLDQCGAIILVSLHTIQGVMQPQQMNILLRCIVSGKQAFTDVRLIVFIAGVYHRNTCKMIVNGWENVAIGFCYWLLRFQESSEIALKQIHDFQDNEVTNMSCKVLLVMLEIDWVGFLLESTVHYGVTVARSDEGNLMRISVHTLWSLQFGMYVEFYFDGSYARDDVECCFKDGILKDHLFYISLGLDHVLR